MITKRDTHLRKAIPAEIKLAITLRYLATGESLDSLMWQFRVHKSTITQFIGPVCKSKYNAFSPEYMAVPQSPENWMELVKKTSERWQFLNAFAAVDGKHFSLICPSHSGSDYYNYKGFYSIVLLAFVDYDYKFLLVEVGTHGRISDGGICRNSVISQQIKDGSLQLPPPQPLPKNNHEYWQSFTNKDKLPIVFVADNAFALEPYCMKPYSQKNLSDEKRIFDSQGYRKKFFFCPR